MGLLVLVPDFACFLDMCECMGVLDVLPGAYQTVMEPRLLLVTTWKDETVSKMVTKEVPISIPRQVCVC